MWQFWVDRGGTFTDIVAKRPDGTLQAHKLLSENPERYKDAAIQGVRELLGIERGQPIPPGMIKAMKMGTTVATNALLERKGDRTLFVTTTGFADVLRIGYQNRPRLFDLDIVLPEVLYESVIEADERITNEGDVIIALDEDRIRHDMEAAFADGIRAVAIALMHGYRFPQHEVRIASIAKKIGFTQISTSHGVSPLMKLVSRGDTTVVDAYLSPILRRYVDQVSDELGAESGGCEHLMFMQSNGGLTDARLFQGKDAILSGPAGGVVGMVKTAEIAGFTKLIGFDMGGTSTDVCHYDGELERSLETEVSGIRMRVPMMHIHTVAAGGGSILQFDGARFRVGPASAGANPGPACYRRGGPLTVTDCNVMLGKIAPQHFPRVFGPNGDELLDQDSARLQFAALADATARNESVPTLTPEEVAEGFLRIAVENMANAIKKISVQRGYDVTEYTLTCFGGAGGQHACMVADALGMKQVLIHPLAGVLSAYGMGLADIRAIRTRQFEKSLIPGIEDELETLCNELKQETIGEVSAQGIEVDEISVLRRAQVRYANSVQTLAVDIAPAETMHRVFNNAHKQRFGFASEDRELIIESVSVEAVGTTDSVIEPELDCGAPMPAIAASQVRMHSLGEWVDVPLYNRSTLSPGHVVNGPAIIIEPTGTNLVEDGWQASINRFEHLILTRIEERLQTKSVGTQVDPVMLEVFNNLFMSIADQMGATLANTAYSVNIKERYDFSCALFGPDGDLVANAPHVPVHLGSMSETVRTLIQRNQNNMKPGDVYMHNVPFNGGTHLPDVTVVTPVFDLGGKRILFYVGSRGHHADIGGTTPGSAPPDSRHIDEEGVLIDNVKLVDQGRLCEEEVRTLLASGAYPCRNPDQNMADLAAQIAANETGATEIRKKVEHFGLDVVQAYMQHIQDNAEYSVRQVLSVLNDGNFTYPLDNGKVIEVKIRVDQERQEAEIDFTGTSPQDEGNFNAPLAICKAAVLYVFRTLVQDEIPLNEGCMKPLKIIAPEGSIINCQYPAAVIAGNTEISQGICDALYGALGVIAASQGTMNNFVYGNEEYQNYETICGGTGAGPTFDGASAVQSHMTNTRMTDPEVLENRFPVRVERFSIRKGSGGSGAHRGGDGAERQVRFLEPMTVTTLTSHRVIPPFGVNGGEPGKCGRNRVLRMDGSVEELGANEQCEMKAGDVFSIETPGGGGFGKPLPDIEKVVDTSTAPTN